MPTIQNRRATKAQWESANPVLASGEIGLEVGPDLTISKLKVGNGFASWSELPYFVSDSASARETGLSSVAFRSAISQRRERPLSVAVFADSRGEGYRPAAPEGVTNWSDTFPGVLNSQLRSALGLPQGGRGWLPLKRSAANEQYNFAGPTFADGSPLTNDIIGDTGVPGSQWIIPVADGGKVIRVPLSPGTTSVDFVSASGGAHYILLTGQSGETYEGMATNSDTQTVSLTRFEDPGTYIDVVSPGGGFAGLGFIEYVGDEDSGVHMYNFSSAGITAKAMATQVAHPIFTELLNRIAPDLSITALGGNDIGAGNPASQVATSLSSILTNAGGEKVALTVIRAGDGSNADWTALNTAIRGLSGTTVVDLASLGANSSAPAFAGWFLSDLKHIGLSGSVGFADATLNTILGDKVLF
ncbi:hydrolase [Gordonia phage OhMyWard]|uniref:Esterase n=1 Tax=Gordonia phage OhMyWard TaxID=2652414 RepID=A0A5P8D779_9CAUD|nr:tail fiber protein [Gordonia phage OhMyWard]QFP94885.1 hydrolase [Gordonia phage OhMyWard]